MIMSGQMRKYNFSQYYKQLESMSEPILASELPKVKLNLRGIRDYAKNKGVTVSSLSDAEKKMFMQG